MSLSSFLLSLPTLLLLLLLIILCAGFNTLLTYYFRKHRDEKSGSTYEKAGDYFALLGGIYGLLLGFVVVLSWGAYNDTQSNADKEESVALSFYREIHYLPDSSKAALLEAAYINYVNSVVHKEYPLMEELKPFNADLRNAFSEVYRQLEMLNAIDPTTSKMIEHLDELAMYRSLRELGAYSEIPLEIWIPLVLGYLILSCCALFIEVKSRQMHVLLNCLLGSFIGIIYYIILLVNHPFAGSMKIEPQQYQAILEMAGRN